MKVRIPKSWFNLPQGEKDAIIEFSKHEAYEEMEKAHSLIIKLACIALNDSLGVGEQRLNKFITAYKDILKQHEKYMSDDVNNEIVDRRIKEIFKEGFTLESVSNK